jgi:leader peptidase (prepilin peptidase)/N-methyltransferase
MADWFVLIVLAIAAGLAACAAWRELAIPATASASCLALIAAVTFIAQHALGGDWRGIAVLLLLLLICVLIAEIDRRFHIIPDTLVAAIVALAFCAPAFNPLGSLIGAATTGVLFWLVRAGFARLGVAEALGLGDVKLATAMGAFLGPTAALLAVATAAAATAALIGLRRAPRASDAVLTRGAPLGIGLAAALFVAALFQASTA